MDYRQLKLQKKYLSKNFLKKDSLIPRNAVACILTLNNEYVVQLRDDKPNIFFPSFWSLFGGEIEKNENPENALTREIYEEINLRIKKGDRIAQLILEKVLTPEIRELGELAKTLRGEGGFGSTGTN